MKIDNNDIVNGRLTKEAIKRIEDGGEDTSLDLSRCSNLQHHEKPHES